MSKRLYLTLAALAATVTWAMSASAAVLVNDTWLDGNRTDPTTTLVAGPHSEYGADGDSDGNLESVWYTVPATALSTPAGHLVMDNTNGGVNTTSSSYTTYFAPDATPVTLAAAGHSMKVTWVFVPTGVATTGTSQQFLLAVADSPTALRLTADGSSPGAGAYTGYAMYMNMRTGTLGNGNSFQLRERTGTGNFLSSSGEWTALVNGANASTPGYTSGTQYTFEMTLTRNAASGLDIVSTMSGTGLGGAGNQISVSHTDASPSGFTYDMFGVRPASPGQTASSFDTTLFKVEFIVPEPGSAVLVAFGGLAALAFRRRR